MRFKTIPPPLILNAFVLRFSGGSKQHLAELYTLFELFFFLPCAGGLVAILRLFLCPMKLPAKTLRWLSHGYE